MKILLLEDDLMLGKAVKYSFKNSEIILDFNQNSEEIFLKITNFGEEISPDEIDKLFEKFYRTKASNVLGCGLGLAIVKKIVDLHDGKILFSSKGEDLVARNIVELRILKN